MRHTIHLLFLAFTLIEASSCNKSSFLDQKPDQSLVIPKTINDFQAILDNEAVMNGSSIEGGRGVTPSFGEIGADDYIVKKWITASFTKLLQNMYIWNDDIYGQDIEYDDWRLPYNSIFYANLVLDGMKDYKPSQGETIKYNNLIGSALFFRAFMHFQLAQVYAPPYDGNLAQNLLGIPLRETADVNEKLVRSNLKETYDFIVSDLLLAKDLLPDMPLAGLKNRPSKCAAFALLARVFQTMNDYSKSLEYANSSLTIYDQLLDYNTIDSTSNFPFPQNNKEIIFSTAMVTIPSFFFLRDPEGSRVDSNVLKSYKIGDLRKPIFFSSVDSTFKGSYDFTGALFSGIATDEVYLIRAECNARLGNIELAMQDLNSLLRKRWNNSLTYVEFSTTNPNEAIQVILLERRKELLFRGIRWSDLRRLNKLGSNITIKRTFEGKEYILTPNSNNYTYLIPPDIMAFNTDWQQNLR